MERKEIETFLPHRPPMLLVDRVELDAEGIARGEYTVRGDEHFLEGHFPGYPVVPGVVLCEIIAQSAGVLVREELQKSFTPLFAGMEGVRFRRMVRPGDVIRTVCKPIRIMGNLLKVAGEARVDGQICAEGTFLLMLSRVDI